ncbi:S9 family peptidase [Virgibacillus halodenitrificans]|uniref:S9 family peptidase n=1 Tax=Virgibacillus halodenitrificans TaxID=1482 RepID=UPI001F29ED74|nr:alpha/beta fold hydrolase [Virgibacillus halodenitrificans]MCG1027225.1 S9 family peptidase [Virgibacillus halodenitrificans]
MQSELTDYLKINGVSQLKKVPNSNKITYVHRKSGLPQLYEFDLKTRKERPFVRTDGRVLSAHHSTNGEYSIIEVDYKGNEKKQIFLYKRDTQSLERLAYSLEYLHHFGSFSPDGTKIIYTTYQENDVDSKVYLIDLTTREKELIVTWDGSCNVVKWLKNGKDMVIQVQETNLDTSYWILNIEDLSKRRIGSMDEVARYQSIVFTKEQKEGYLLSDSNSEFMQVCQFSLNNHQKISPCITSIPWDIEEVKLSLDETKLALSVNEGGTSTIYMYHVADSSLEEITDLPMGVKSNISWLTNDSFLFLLKGPQVPGEVYTYHISQCNVSRITDVGYLDASKVRRYNPTMYTFPSFDGVEVPYFYYAKHANPTSALIYVHGGPENLSRVDFNPVLQALVDAGVAVIVPNIRGSKGFGRTYLELDDRRKRLDAAKDIEALAMVAFEKHGIDQSKLGIMGRSYGGFIVNTVSAYYPHLWAAAVSIVGISHIGTFLEKTGSYRRRSREHEYGFLSEDIDFFDEISPINHVEKVNAPLLLCHGRHDSRVAVEESIQFQEKLTDLGKEVSIIISEEDGHQMGGATCHINSYVSMQTKIVEFLDQHLND